MNEVTSYKCPSCGATLQYKGLSGKLECDSCHNVFDPENIKQMDQVMRNVISEKHAAWNRTPEEGEEIFTGMADYSCPSCGGEIIAEETTSATFCPFCGSATIMGGQLSGAYRPDLILPFRLDREAATSALRAYYKKKPLLPQKFKDENHIKEIKGIYVPFWLYSCDTEGSYRYRATRVHSWTDGRFQHTDTDYYMISRDGNLSFLKIPADASKKMENAIMDALEPFDFSQAHPFEAAYLSGFYADKYDVSAKENADRVNQRIRHSVEEAFRDTVQGFSSIHTDAGAVKMKNDQVQYALLPVWMLTTEYQGNTYLFAMNGQSGKLIGDLPVSKSRFAAWLFGIAAISEAAFLLVLLLGGFLL